MPCTGVAVASGFEIETLLPPPGDGGRSATGSPEPEPEQARWEADGGRRRSATRMVESSPEAGPYGHRRDTTTASV
jgi:hypothetical protein